MLIYSHQKWLLAATLLHTDKEVRKYFTSSPIVGKTIRRIHLTGEDAYHSGNFDILLYEYCSRHRLPLIPKKQQNPNDLEYGVIPNNLQFCRLAIINEPMIIEFTDGYCMELVFDSLVNELQISNNQIPLDAIGNLEERNIDGNILFSSCLWETITDIEFSTLPNREYKIPKICIHLSANMQLQIIPNNKGCIIYLTEQQDTGEKAVPIYWRELKKAFLNLQKQTLLREGLLCVSTKQSEYINYKEFTNCSLLIPCFKV